MAGIFSELQAKIDALGFISTEITGADAKAVSAPVPGKEEYEWYVNQIFIANDRQARYSSHASTRICLLNGTNPTIGELTEKYKDKPNEIIWLYAYDLKNNKIVPGKAHHPRKTQINQQLYKVILDDGQILRFTGNHPFLLTNGEYKDVEYLKPGDSLMSLYQKYTSMRKGKKFEKQVYEQIYQPIEEKWQYTHRMVMKELEQKYDSKIHTIHHKNFVKINNSPEKFGCHFNTVARTLKREGYPTFNKLNNQLHANHKVVSVEKDGIEDVYDLTVEEHHNFAVMGENTDGSIESRMKYGAIIVSNSEYEDMGIYPEISSAIDVYADSATQRDISGHVLKINSQDQELQEELEELFFTNLDIDSKLWAIVRNVCQYGDLFAELVFSPELDSVLYFKTLPPKSVVRFERDGKLLAFVQNVPGGASPFFDPFEVVHFKVAESYLQFRPYGSSVLEAARRPYRQLRLMEDAMVVYRISRAPERRIFKIDCGNLPTVEAEKYVNKIKSRFRKKPFINAQTNEVDYKCLALDTKIPLLDGRTLTIQELINEHKQDKQNWVYSLSEKGIAPGKIINAQKTINNEKRIRVYLDNDKHIDCTFDHPFMIRDGSYIKAGELKKNDELMPLYRKLSIKENKMPNYEMVYNPIGNRWDFTHQVIGRELYLYKGVGLLHHSDYNKQNNSPENLKFMTFEEHGELHINNQTPEQRKINCSNAGKKAWQNLEWRERKLAQNIEKLIYFWESEGLEERSKAIKLARNTIESKEKTSKQALKQWKDLNFKEQAIKEMKKTRKRNGTTDLQLKASRENGYKVGKQNIAMLNIYRILYKGIIEKPTFYEWKENYINHKVVRIEPLPFFEVGDITIEGFHNFATDVGVFVHNSNPFCLTGDTEVPLLDGRTLSIKDIVEEQKQGKENWVYSVDLDNNFAPKFEKILRAEKTRENAELVKITFDNNKSVRCTPDHHFPLKDWTKVKACELKLGDSIASLENDLHKIKVVSVEYLEERKDTYNITVGGSHLYALQIGVFTSNSVDEDFWFPFRTGNAGSSVTQLDGAKNLGDILDVQYFKDKIFAVLKIPRAYLQDKDSTKGDHHSNLAQQDVMFARTIDRIQRHIIQGLQKIAIVHLILRGYDKEKLFNFKIELTPCSDLEEMNKLESIEKRIKVAKEFKEMGVPDYWIWNKMLQFTKEQIDAFKKLRKIEDIEAAQHQAAISSMNIPVPPPPTTTIEQSEIAQQEIPEAIPEIDIDSQEIDIEKPLKNKDFDAETIRNMLKFEDKDTKVGGYVSLLQDGELAGIKSSNSNYTNLVRTETEDTKLQEDAKLYIANLLIEEQKIKEQNKVIMVENKEEVMSSDINFFQ